MEKLFTIGFTEKKASDFFDLLINAGIKSVIDVRLNNKSQLSGFAKRNDLQYFLREIGNIDYVEAKDLAPEPEMLSNYLKKNMSWEEYADRYLNLISKRNVERLVDKNQLAGSCLLCSEHLPHHCHRRLAAEYLNLHLGSALTISHLIK
ncbi:MAG: DUF488 domain-containing protein [Candidatus Nitrotoga sp.]